jgi:MFS family permease
MMVLGLVGLGLSFTLTILNPFIYTAKTAALAPPELKNSALGLLTIISLLVALVTQPLVGRRSDRTGKRTPYLVGGVAGLAVSLPILVLADSGWLLIGATASTAFFSNMLQGAWQPLIPDQVPAAQHGLAAGLKTLFEVSGAVAGFALISVVMVRGTLWVAAVVAAGLFGVILFITLVALWHSPVKPVARPPQIEREAFRLKLDLREAPAFPWWMLNRMLFWSSGVAFYTFLLNYIQDVLSLSPAEAVHQVLGQWGGILLGVAILGLVLSAGALSDRLGRRPLLAVAGLLGTGGALLPVVERDLGILLVAGGLVGGAVALFAGASWSLVTGLVPDKKRALYLGLANGATVVGSIGGRLGGPLIDGLNYATGTTTVGYLAVFVITALFFGGSSLVLLNLPDSK